MFRLFETVRVENGVPLHPEWHEARISRARKELWGIDAPVDLHRLIRVPAGHSEGTVRCNVFYEADSWEVTFRPYHPKVIRSLKMVDAGTIDYHLKYADRRGLEALLALRGEAGEIILVRNGLLTDTSVSNLIFTDGHGWFTPATPLLKGTCRERLLAEGAIAGRDIRPDDLGNYLGCKLINAMRYPDEGPLIPVSAIS